jgi:nitrate reductase delta subunit
MTRTTDKDIAAARLAASWLISYPDDRLTERLDMIAEAVANLPDETRIPLQTFLGHVADTPFGEIQRHYVALFDMRRRACPFLSYWTDGDTRNRGMAIVKFKQAYSQSGFELTDEELPDHIAVVLEFAAVGDKLTGNAILAEFAAPIGLLRDALVKMDSVYSHVLDAVIATLPKVTPEIEARMMEIAANGPPTEEVGLEPFPQAPDLLTIGARR